jgi:hypothetical protein
MAAWLPIAASLAAGAAGSIASAQHQGGLFDTSVSRKRAFRQWFDNRYNAMQGDPTRAYGEARAQLQSGLQKQREGFTKARQEAGRAGQGAQQSILDTEQRMYGGLGQNLVGSGLTGTSAGGNFARGIASDANRRLIDLQSTLASLYSGLATQQGAAEAAGGGALADLSIGQYGAEQQAKEAFNQWRVFRSTGQNQGMGAFQNLGPLFSGIGGAAGSYQSQQNFDALLAALGGG